MSSIAISRIIRSKRRSIALVVEHDATLTVRAPHRVSDAYINELVMKKRVWIEEKKHQMLSLGVVKEKQYVDGEVFLFLGKEYTLTFCYGKSIELIEQGGVMLFPRKFLMSPKRAMLAWYKKMAYMVIKERVSVYEQISSWKHSSLTITSARTRWGSCGGDGAINFSWRLMMVPLSSVDYVVVHELAHIKERNHSARFWSAVEHVLPHYQEEEKRLKQYQRKCVL